VLYLCVCVCVFLVFFVGFGGLWPPTPGVVCGFWFFLRVGVVFCFCFFVVGGCLVLLIGEMPVSYGGSLGC